MLCVFPIIQVIKGLIIFLHHHHHHRRRSFLPTTTVSASKIRVSNHESVTIITLFLDSQMPKSEAIPQEMYKKKVFFFFLYTEIESSSVASKTRKKKIKNNSRTNLFKTKKRKTTTSPEKQAKVYIAWSTKFLSFFISYTKTWSWKRSRQEKLRLLTLLSSHM